ncbi:peptide deformylase [Jannaschia faecimaris]|uniref:Peptide deformylase n=1 Tax=Jannaschia faecimaris TaxID=1244108 RepID=A0A1H3U070_9RHOB|nr:peptide deformylase [Jannaschia faecimaris]SDZ55441.1 peptide deformylase [Jannaschia faecimaris]
MIRPIVMYPDPILAAACALVTGDAAALSRDMLDTMYAANGRGLAASQVAVTERMFVMDCGWKTGVPDPRVFVNPEITQRQGRQVNIEGCLSIPDTPRRIERPARVRLAFDGPTGRRSEDFSGFAAACVCHEMDHLNGVLILDLPEVAEEPPA